MKKGFTLIELLAVIIILAIIALITTPIILNIVNDSRKQSFKNGIFGIIDATKIYSATHLNDDSNTTFKILDQKLKNETDNLTVTGELPTSGSINMLNGNTELAFYSSKYSLCATKQINETDITIESLNESSCLMKNGYLQKYKGIIIQSSNAGLTNPQPLVVPIYNNIFLGSLPNGIADELKYDGTTWTLVKKIGKVLLTGNETTWSDTAGPGIYSIPRGNLKVNCPPNEFMTSIGNSLFHTGANWLNIHASVASDLATWKSKLQTQNIEVYGQLTNYTTTTISPSDAHGLLAELSKM